MTKPNFAVNCGFCKTPFIVKRKSYLDQIRRDKEHIFYCSQECRVAKAKTGKIINCFVCGKEAYKTAKELEEGAQFCSRSCSAQFNNVKRTEEGYSLKDKLKELQCVHCGNPFQGCITTPISLAICGICCTNKEYEYNCVSCGTIIYGSYGGIKYCDPCRAKVVSSKIQIRIDNGTLFSKSIRCEYIFNDKKIRCDSKLEYVCLTYFQSKYDVIYMDRAQMILSYQLDDKVLNYFPDFEIVLKDGTKYLVECKGVVGKKLSDKWHDYNRKSVEKKKVLEKWCQENGYIPFWFDQQRHNKIYKNTKIDA
jgi:hypothetical protein